MKQTATALMATLLLFSFSTNGVDWKKEYDDGEMKIYTRAHTNGVKEFKGVITIETSLLNCVGLLYDVSKHPDFMYSVGEGKVVDKESDLKRYLHYIVDMPWPLDNRDIVSLVSTDQDPETKTVRITTKSTPDKIPRTEYERMERAEGLWEFKPLNNGKVQVTYQYLSDPEGIPTWVVNMFLLSAPKNTLNGFKETIAGINYSSGDFPWLME